MGIFIRVFDTEYTHVNGEDYQSWASIDNLNGDDDSYTYYETQNGVQVYKKENLVSLLMMT